MIETLPSGVGDVVVGGFALVRDQHLRAVRREGEHVGERADVHAAELGERFRRRRRRRDRYRSWGLLRRLPRSRRRRLATLFAAPSVVSPSATSIGLDELRRGGVGDVEHVDGRGRGVHDEDAHRSACRSSRLGRAGVGTHRSRSAPGARARAPQRARCRRDLLAGAADAFSGFALIAVVALDRRFVAAACPCRPYSVLLRHRSATSPLPLRIAWISAVALVALRRAFAYGAGSSYGVLTVGAVRRRRSFSPSSAPFSP